MSSSKDVKSPSSTAVAPVIDFKVVMQAVIADRNKSKQEQQKTQSQTTKETMAKFETLKVYQRMKQAFAEHMDRNTVVKVDDSTSTLIPDPFIFSPICPEKDWGM